MRLIGGPYLEMLVHDHLAIPLQHAQDLPAFGNVAGAWVDFDVHGPAGDLAAGGYGRGGSGSSSDGCHAVTKAELRAWLSWWSSPSPAKLTSSTSYEQRMRSQFTCLVSAK